MKDIRSYNIGKSDYAKYKIQPWDIWEEYGLNPWDADIIKRVLRTKEGNDRKMDYEKIIHVCQERIRQLEAQEDFLTTRILEALNEIRVSYDGEPYMLVGDFMEFKKHFKAISEVKTVSINTVCGIKITESLLVPDDEMWIIGGRFIKKLKL